MFYVAIIFHYLTVLAIIAMGVFLIIHKHPVAGGWTIFGGLLIASSSWSSKTGDKE